MPVSKMDEIIPLFDALQQHDKQYDSGDTDYSVTTLLDPPRVVHLNKRHKHKCQLYVEDLMHSFSGTAMHNYTEQMLLGFDPEGKIYKTEERLPIIIKKRKVSGAYDIVMNMEDLYDMKNTSVWKAIFGDRIDWTAQQNMYRYLFFQKHRIELKSLSIIAWFKDWSRRELYRGGKDYPKEPIQWYKLPIWTFDKTIKYMTERVELMAAHEDTKDDDLPECTYKEMWSSPDQVAIKTKRLKRALRVCDSKKAADKWLNDYMQNSRCKDKIKDITYEYRTAERTRCESWCPINKYCNQYHNFLKAVAKGGK